MKRLIFSEDIFHTLAQLEDKEAGLMAKAIACYAHDGTEPKLSNSILMALFSLFKKQIDAQSDSEERRRIVNKENAKGKNCKKPRNMRKTADKNEDSSDSESKTNPNEESELQQIAAETIPFEQMEAIYPKIDSSESYRRESLLQWNTLSEEEKQNAIAYLNEWKQNPSQTTEIGYLRQFLTNRTWEKN